jgi:hypothetical protein
MQKVNMQTCWEIINECTTKQYDTKVEFGTLYFFLSEEDFKHVFEHQDIIRTLISPKYQIMFYDFGMKSVVITLTRNLL